MRFLFTSAALPGHLDWGGYLRTAVALQAQGHDVLWVSGQEVAATVQEVGVPLSVAPTVGWRLPLPAAQPAQARHLRALAGWLEPDEVCRGVESLCAAAAAFRPDALVSELFVTAAPVVAERLGLPLAICGWPAQATPPPSPDPTARQALAEARTRLAAIWQATGVTGRYWSDANGFWPVSPTRHIVYFSPRWYGSGLPLLPQTACVGGTAQPPQGAQPDFLAALPTGRPLVLVTLGSLFTDDIHFFTLVAQAVAGVGGHSVAVVGHSALAPDLAERLRQRRLPHTTLLDWVNYDWLFPRLAAAVHHGGVATTHAAICHGLPQLIIPHAGDQALQARRAAATGVGVHLAPAATNPATLQAALHDLLANPLWRTRAAHLQAEFGALGGPAHAARLLAAAI